MKKIKHINGILTEDCLLNENGTGFDNKQLLTWV